MKTLCTFIFVIVFASAGAKQATVLSAKVDSIVRKIEKEHTVETGSPGESGGPLKQYRSFELLSYHATVSELKVLLDHEDPVIRCYSFWALGYHHEQDIYSLLIAHLNDTARIRIIDGCIGSGGYLADFLIELVTPDKVDNSVKKLTKVEQLRLDSILIYSQGKLSSRDIAIQRVGINETLYKRLRELAVNEMNVEALIAVAKFRKQQDIDLIKSFEKNKEHKFWVYLAIASFPDPAFFRMLEDNITWERNEYKESYFKALYRAIVSYHNKEAVELLRIPIERTQNSLFRPYNLEWIFDAVRKSNDTIFNEVLWDLWANDNFIDKEVYSNLLKINRSRAMNLTNVTLSSEERLSYLLAQELGEQNVTDIMMAELLQSDSSAALQMIINHLEKADISVFLFCENWVIRTKHQSFILPLLKRMENDRNYISLHAASALASYRNKEINDRILTAPLKNDVLIKGQMGERYKELLKDYSIKP